MTPPPPFPLLPTAKPTPFPAMTDNRERKEGTMKAFIRGIHGSYKEGLSRKDKTLVVSNVATVRLPIGYVFAYACAAIEVFRIRVVFETRNLKGGISFIVVTAKVSHQTLPGILPCQSPMKQVEH